MMSLCPRSTRSKEIAATSQSFNPTAQSRNFAAVYVIQQSARIKTECIVSMQSLKMQPGTAVRGVWHHHTSRLTPAPYQPASPISNRTAKLAPQHAKPCRPRPCRYRDPSAPNDAAAQQEPRKSAAEVQQLERQVQQLEQYLQHEKLREQQQRAPMGFRGRAVVVGAGPAGATAAMYLASAGYQVDVLERRGHPGQLETDKRRTYLIGLGERGLASLDKLGISVGPGVGRPMQGSVYAYKSGKRIEDPFTADTRIIGVDRQGLTAFLVDEAARRFPDAITFHFNVKPDLDLSQRRVRFVSRESNQRTGSPMELPYDLLVGADGAGSSVRAALELTVPDVTVTRLSSPVGSMEYKAFTGLPWNDDIRAMLPAGADGPGAGMTFFALNNPQPDKPSPGSITLYCLKDWAGTMYLPEGAYGQLQGVADHAAAIRQFTPPNFPEEWIPLMAQQMAQAPASRISPMYLVSHLAVPQLGVVLLGDAGHCVTPQMGQGCNSALEDCVLLARALEGADYDVTAGLTAYDKKRAPQVHALQHMEEENAWVRRPPQWGKDPLDKSLARVAWISFFMLLPLLRVLPIPGLRRTVHASLFQNIMSSTVPYDSLHRAVRVAPLVWGVLLAVVVVAVRGLFMAAMDLVAAMRLVGAV